MISSVINLSRLLAACVLAVFILYTVKPDTDVAFDQAAAAGADTGDYYARNGNFPVHCADARDIDDCINGLKFRAQNRAALWLGNSQLHAINQLKENEVSSAKSLHDTLLADGWDLLTLSQPNANLQEHYVLFEYMRQQVALDALLLPVVFDDTREDGLREHISSLAILPGVVKKLAGTQIGQELVDKSSRVAEDSGVANRQLWQDRSEATLNSVMAKYIPLWSDRADLRSTAIFALYRLRNSIFGISASTKRKVLPGPYSNNLAALNALLQSAQSAAVPTLVYIAPIRNDVELPYEQAEYTGRRALSMWEEAIVPVSTSCILQPVDT